MNVHPLHKFDRLTDILITDTNNADNLVGFNALMLAAYCDCQTMAEWLVTLPLDVNHRSENGGTVLLYAADDDVFASVVESLLEKGANPNAVDNSGWSALFSALRNNAPTNAQVLLAAGADALYQDETGYTALMAAAKGGCAELIPKLITSGVELNADWESATALDMALAEKHAEIAQCIMAAGGVRGSKPIVDAPTEHAPSEAYFHDLMAQLKLCMPVLKVDALLSIAPPTTFYDDYGANTTVLYWLSAGLEAQGLLEYQEWKEYWGDLPALSPLQDLTLAYDARPLLQALDRKAENADTMWDTPPYIELMNHHLKPHGLQIISFAHENLYMLCVRDSAEQVDKLAKLLALAGIHVITHSPMDLNACLKCLLE
jgi:Ankyrin repeats (3 copies)/Ankyrin repeat